MKHLLCIAILYSFLGTTRCTLSHQINHTADKQITISAPISCGELVDKITILEIKAEQIENASKLQNILNELQELIFVYQQLPSSSELEQLKNMLKFINQQLWDIEDAIRQQEHEKLFDSSFIWFARHVYMINDERARVKRQINQLLGSYVVEEKSYRNY